MIKQLLFLIQIIQKKIEMLNNKKEAKLEN